MTARDVLETNIDPAVPADMAKASIDDFAAEVLREGAAELDSIADETEARVAAHYGLASGIGPGSAELVREAARTLRAVAAERYGQAPTNGTPDFFRPGRTYAYDASGFTAPELLTVFRVVATTIHPSTGKRTAFGWIRGEGDKTWTPHAEPADEWPACWTDVTAVYPVGGENAQEAAR